MSSAQKAFLDRCKTSPWMRPEMWRYITPEWSQSAEYRYQLDNLRAAGNER